MALKAGEETTTQLAGRLRISKDKLYRLCGKYKLEQKYGRHEHGVAEEIWQGQMVESFLKLHGEL